MPIVLLDPVIGVAILFGLPLRLNQPVTCHLSNNRTSQMVARSSLSMNGCRCARMDGRLCMLVQPIHLMAYQPRFKNYCSKVPSSGCVLASSGGITTAAATLS